MSEETKDKKEESAKAKESVAKSAKKSTEVKEDKKTSPEKESKETSKEAVKAKTEDKSSEVKTDKKASSEKESKEAIKETVEAKDKSTDQSVGKDSKEDKKEEALKAEPDPIENKVSDTPPAERKPEKDFDWEKLGKYDEAYSKEEENKLEKVYDKTLTTISKHDIVEGKITAMSDREIVVDIDYKSDGVVSLTEAKYNPDLKVGDTIEVFIESLEDQEGQLVLSHKKARTLKAWDHLNEALETNEIIKGYVKCRTKGGLIVDAFGIEAFLPGSQIDVKPIRDFDIYVDKSMEFKVVKINKEFKNVVVSHKALIKAEIEEQKKEIISKLEKGQILEGIVKNITSYGVFVDLGGIDGLIHITDLSWGRINHPEEVVELDEKIKVVILDFDDDKKRIALGVKQMEKHPWESLNDDLKIGDKVKGKVVVVADYGAFVEIQPGVEGLIHVSEISWSKHLKPAQEFFEVAQEVDAVVLTLDREDRKMSLGVKQLTPDPWEEIEKDYPVDSKHKGKVTNISDFGVFVELGEGIDGLVHISDLSWAKKINHPSEVTKVGEDIEIVILEIDKENRRLSLGYKQLEENPWDVFETTFQLGSKHEGVITKLKGKAAIVALPYGVEGVAYKRDIEKEDGSLAKEDEKLEFVVKEFNKHAKKIVVSHTLTFKDDEDTRKRKDKARKKKSKKAVHNVQKNIERTTLGDLDSLSSLKKGMEEDEASYKKENEEKDK